MPAHIISRRTWLAGSSAVATLTALHGLPSQAQAQVSADALMQPGPLAEMTLGDPAAPVTLVEYASATCGHCATFHLNTYPALKEKYIETGKVFFVFREFPLDPLAAAAFMLARCVPEEAYFDFIDLLFEKQRDWAFSDKPVDALFSMAKQGGLTRADFDSCLSNQELLDGIRWVRERAEKEFDVGSTPTFFLNGALVRGAVSLEELEQRLKPHLES